MLKKIFNYPFVLVVIISLIGANRALDYYFNCERDKEIRSVIEKIINTQANASLIFPESLLISTEDSLLKVHFDSLKNKVIHKVADRYINSKEVIDSGKIIDIDIVNFSLKDTAKITHEDLVRLKNHIAYLSDNINEAIESCKKDYENELSSLNRWLSVWIGVLAILGVFIPIVINYKVTDNIDNLTTLVHNSTLQVNTLIPQVHQLTSEFNLFKAIDDLEDINHSFLTRCGIEHFTQNITDCLEVVNRSLESFRNILNYSNNEVWRYLDQLNNQLASLVIPAGRHRNQLQPISEFNVQLGDLLKQQNLITEDGLNQSIQLINQLITKLRQA